MASVNNTSDPPLISVIVPVYNVEQYLRKCLDSICGQTYRNLEIICVNDGSTDGSAAILEEYAARDARIRVFTQANGGLAAARNTGLRHASGEWIMAVDSDDYLEPDTVEYTLRGAIDTVDVVHFGYESQWPEAREGNFTEPDWIVEMDGEQPITSHNLLHTPVMFCAKLWRTSFLRKNNVTFPENLWYEDLMVYWQHMPTARAIYYLPGRKYKYTRRQDSIMGQSINKSPKALDHLVILNRLLEWRQTHPLPPELKMLDFCNTIYCHHVSKQYAPDELHEHVDCECKRLIEKYGLARKWHQLQWFVCPLSSFQRLFVARKSNKISFHLFGIPVFSYHMRDFVMTERIFGIKTKRYSLL